MRQCFRRPTASIWPIALAGAALVIGFLPPASVSAQTVSGEGQATEPGGDGHTLPQGNIIIVPPGYTAILSGGSVILVPTYVGYWWWSPTPAVAHAAIPYVGYSGFAFFQGGFTWIHISAPAIPFWAGAWPILGYGYHPTTGVLPGAVPLAVTRRDLYAPVSRGYWSDWLTRRLRKRPPPFNKPWGRW